MFCHKCGKKIEKDSKFCVNCSVSVSTNVKTSAKKPVSKKTAKETERDIIGFEWFDSNEGKIKDEKKLSSEQINYVKEPSVSILGPFNFLVRKHWDILIVIVLLNIASAILEESESSIFDLLVLVGYACMIYFAIKHGRRLAWNRNDWKNFEHFKKSEDAWKPWGVIMAIVGGLTILSAFFGGF